MSKLFYIIQTDFSTWLSQDPFSKSIAEDVSADALKMRISVQFGIEIEDSAYWIKIGQSNGITYYRAYLKDDATLLLNVIHQGKTWTVMKTQTATSLPVFQSYLDLAQYTVKAIGLQLPPINHLELAYKSGAFAIYNLQHQQIMIKERSF